MSRCGAIMYYRSGGVCRCGQYSMNHGDGQLCYYHDKMRQGLLEPVLSDNPEDNFGKEVDSVVEVRTSEGELIGTYNYR